MQQIKITRADMTTYRHCKEELTHLLATREYLVNLPDAQITLQVSDLRLQVAEANWGASIEMDSAAVLHHIDRKIATLEEKLNDLPFELVG